MFKDSVLVTGESTYKPRMRVTEANLDPAQEQSVSAIDVDYSTNAPVVNFNAVCLGYSNVAASKAYLDEKLPSELLGISYALGRGMGEDGSIHPQSYQIQSTNFSRKTSINFNHRGGAYIKRTEVFGPGIFYQQ